MPKAIWKRSHKNAGPKKAARRKGALDRLVEAFKGVSKDDPKKADRISAEMKILKIRLGIAS